MTDVKKIINRIKYKKITWLAIHEIGVHNRNKS